MKPVFSYSCNIPGPQPLRLRKLGHIPCTLHSSPTTPCPFSVLRSSVDLQEAGLASVERAFQCGRSGNTTSLASEQMRDGQCILQLETESVDRIVTTRAICSRRRSLDVVTRRPPPRGIRGIWTAVPRSRGGQEDVLIKSIIIYTDGYFRLVTLGSSSMLCPQRLDTGNTHVHCPSIEQRSINQHKSDGRLVRVIAHQTDFTC